MFEKNLKILLNKLRDEKFSQEESIKLVYLFKVWKVLSKNKINNQNLIFERCIKKECNAKYLNDIFQQLSNQFYVFKLFNNSIDIKKLSNNLLYLIMEFVSQQTKFLKLYDAIDLLERQPIFIISNQIAEFAVKLLNTHYSKLYLPFTNSFNIAYYTDKKVFAESYADELTIEIIKILDNLTIEFYQTNVLEQPSYVIDNKLEEFDCTVSFPPMGVKDKSLTFANDIYNRFEIYRGKGSLDVAHFEHILAQTRRKAVVLMPVGFTFRSGVEEKFRKYLIDKNWLEAIIQLPTNLYSATSIETTFFVINKSKSHRNVYFLNLRDKQFIIKEGRKQVLNNIDEIIETYKNCKEIENISTLVSNFEIKENNYSFSVDRYIFSKEDVAIKKILDNYETQQLQDIATIKKSQLIQDEKDGISIYEISPSDFKSFGFTFECGKVKNIQQQHNKYETYKLIFNDILISTKGTVGKIAIVGDIKKPMIASQAIQVIRIKNRNIIEPKVLYMFLKSNIGQALLKQLSTGTTMPQITTKEIKELKIPILNMAKQQESIEKFEYEVQLFEEIELLKQKIHKINNNFLGDFDNE